MSPAPSKLFFSSSPSTWILPSLAASTTLYELIRMSGIGWAVYCWNRANFLLSSNSGTLSFSQAMVLGHDMRPGDKSVHAGVHILVCYCIIMLLRRLQTKARLAKRLPFALRSFADNAVFTPVRVLGGAALAYSAVALCEEATHLLTTLLIKRNRTVLSGIPVYASPARAARRLSPAAAASEPTAPAPQGFAPDAQWQTTGPFVVKQDATDADCCICQGSIADPADEDGARRAAREALRQQYREQRRLLVEAAQRLASQLDQHPSQSQRTVTVQLNIPLLSGMPHGNAALQDNDWYSDGSSYFFSELEVERRAPSRSSGSNSSSGSSSPPASPSNELAAEYAEPAPRPGEERRDPSEGRAPKPPRSVSAPREPLFNFCEGSPQHVAHAFCIDRWFSSGQPGATLCPECRQPLRVISAFLPRLWRKLVEPNYWWGVLYRSRSLLSSMLWTACISQLIKLVSAWIDVHLPTPPLPPSSVAGNSSRSSSHTVIQLSIGIALKRLTQLLLRVLSPFIVG